MTISIHFKWRQRGLCARRRFEKIIISVGLSRIFQWEIINGAQDYELLRLTCSSANKRISNQLKIAASTNCHKMSQFEGNRICHGLITGDMRELSQSVSFRHSRPRPKFKWDCSFVRNWPDCSSHGNSHDFIKFSEKTENRSNLLKKRCAEPLIQL